MWMQATLGDINRHTGQDTRTYLSLANHFLRLFHFHEPYNNLYTNSFSLYYLRHLCVHTYVLRIRNFHIVCKLQSYFFISCICIYKREDCRYIR